MWFWTGTLLGLTLTGILSVQGPPAPRDPSAAPASGLATHRLAGRVLDADANRPLRRVVVQLTTGNLQTDRWTTTDAEGRWAFERVAPGVYTIRASRDGYVPMAFGQKRAFGAPATVPVPGIVNPGELDITLPRGGVITGTLTDEFGDPVGGALVQAMRLRYVDGQSQLVEVEAGIQTLLYGGMTDDRGEYRIHGLAPGTYYVAGSYGRYAPGQSDDRSGYPRMYYPGTPFIAQAQPVTVAPDEPAMASLAFAPTPLAVVSGRVRNSTSQPVAANVSLVAVAPGHALQGAGSLTHVSDMSGAFAIKGVPTGEYFLHVRTNPRTGPPELASYQFGIAGQDVGDLVVVTTPTGLLTGRLVLEGSVPDVQANAFFVVAVPLEPGAPRARLQAPRARANAGGDFAIPGLWGRHLLRLQNPPEGWSLKSVRIDGEDVTDTGFEVTGSVTSTMVEVVVSQRMASLSGTARDSTGAAVDDYSVVAFSPDEAKWGPGTRFIAAATPSHDGTFSVTGLPPGEYVVIAVPPLEAGEETDPARLARWRSAGGRLSTPFQKYVHVSGGD